MLKPFLSWELSFPASCFFEAKVIKFVWEFCWYPGEVTQRKFSFISTEPQLVFMGKVSGLLLGTAGARKAKDLVLNELEEAMSAVMHAANCKLLLLLCFLISSWIRMDFDLWVNTIFRCFKLCFDQTPDSVAQKATVGAKMDQGFRRNAADIFGKWQISFSAHCFDSTNASNQTPTSLWERCSMKTWICTWRFLWVRWIWLTHRACFYMSMCHARTWNMTRMSGWDQRCYLTLIQHTKGSDLCKNPFLDWTCYSAVGSRRQRGRWSKVLRCDAAEPFRFPRLYNW